ncbi:N-acetyl-D-Glu racemase DgcA [Roseibium suaedae]|uniref:Dipeptide epimerase n=1 Tax=Roseibium suaedae TaxID=735517 RepID=A0A1M7GM15_9HYPH|nr:N-acetyl-D-Glu racemase DgcA [Roseibium suaedae]SHM17168.1 L-alanine-DL-glutamate epimerase [Roseibium suaedae]
MSRSLAIETEAFEIAGGGFAISRGRRTHAHVLLVTLTGGGVTGRGECVPYARYGESLESVEAQIRAVATELEQGADRAAIQNLMPAGAARNAVDCALWDLEAKTLGKSVAQLAGLPPLKPVTTAYTLSVDTPEKMAEAAAKASSRPLLKVKLTGAGDDERLAAVRENAPASTLIVDANEAWDASCFEINMAACLKAGVALIEQPLPAGKDELLAEMDRPVTVCADESLHTSADLKALRNRYDAVNIKLDKAGGLTEALVMARAAKELDFKVMIGCMLGTSLAMAPAVLIAQMADFVDLDGPLLLARDRQPGLSFEGSSLLPPEPALWG